MNGLYNSSDRSGLYVGLFCLIQDFLNNMQLQPKELLSCLQQSQITYFWKSWFHISPSFKER